MLIALTITLRFAHLGRRVYWLDEVIHTIHSFGHYEAELVEAVRAADSPQPLGDLNQFLAPNPDRPAFDTLQILSETEPQSTSIHYLVNRWWSQILGPSVQNQRLLAALLGLALLPVTYWLGTELRGLYPNILPAFPWLATLFVALSPIQVLYSREVRFYSLWVVLSTATTAALLRATRSQSRPQSIRRWGLHTILLIAAAYTFPLEWISVAGRTLWLLLSRRSRWRWLALSQGAALIAFIPWAIVIQQNLNNLKTWRDTDIGAIALIRSWLEGHSLFVVDWFPVVPPGLEGLLSLLTGGLLVVASIGLLVWLGSQHQFVALLLICVGLFPWLIWAALDLVQGGIWSSWGSMRYYLPGSVLFSITFALGLTQWIGNHQQRLRLLCGAALVVWITLGLASNVQIARSQTSRFAFDSNEWVSLARGLRDTDNPLLIVPTANRSAPLHLLTIKQYVTPQKEFIYLDDPSDAGDILSEYDRVYVIAPQPEWQERVNQDGAWTLTALGANLSVLEAANARESSPD